MWGSIGRYSEFSLENVEDLEVEWRIILKIVLNEYDESFWTRLIWLRTGTNGGVL